MSATITFYLFISSSGLAQINLHEFLRLPFLLSETLSQLHGTGLYFKKSLGGSKGVLEKFPNIEEQIQIRKFAQHIFKTDMIIRLIQDTF